MTYLPPDLYAQVERSLPIACVDVVPARSTASGTEVGLILRESPFGQVWCHLGGRVLYGESLTDAVRRHATSTIALAPVLSPNAQPRYVYEWFPPEIAPDDGTVYGDDPRKHAIALSYVVTLEEGALLPRNEALDFAWFTLDELPSPMWPGSAEMIALLRIG